MGHGRQKSVSSLSNRRKSISALFNSVFTGKNTKDVEGLYWLTIWPSDGSLESVRFNEVLHKIVVPHVLKDEEVMLVWRLRNTSPAALGGNTTNGNRPQHGGPCAILARIKDIEVLLFSKTLKTLSSSAEYSDSQTTPLFGSEANVYELAQRFECRRSTSKIKGSCFVTVHIEPKQGEENFVDQWYREEHLDLITKVPCFLRTARYRLRPGIMPGVCNAGLSMLAVHEVTSAKALLDYTVQHGRVMPETPWSKHIFDNAVSVQRVVWDIAGRWQKDGIKLDSL